MVKTPGTCRRISVLWTKHSSTNKFDNSETTATTTMNKAKRISAKSMSHSGKCPLGLPVVDVKHLKSTMVTRRSSPQLLPKNSFQLNPRASTRAAVLSQLPRALSSVLNRAAAITLLELTDYSPIDSRQIQESKRCEVKQGRVWHLAQRL